MRRNQLLLISSAFLLIASFSTAQTTNPAPAAPAQPPQTPATAPVQISPAPNASADSSAKPGAAAGKLLTPEESKELLASIGQMLEFSSQDTGLQIHSQVKGRITSRDAIEKYLVEKLKNDKDAKRMQRSELVMKKFGLLDASFQLRPFLIALLKEQIAGYYDDKTKTMNLLNWVGIDDQKPVMAHELTHALQDQRVNLEKWEKAAGDDSAPSKNFRQDQERVAIDEVGTARDAVLEGQAMIPLIDLSLKPLGQSVLTAPQVIPLMTAQMSQTDPATSPVMARAPLILQESMLFSYSQGLTFEAAILASKGVERAFGGTLDSPPSTSAEIMHPDQYLNHKKEPLLQIPDLHPIIDASYVPYDLGVIGEFDVKTMADDFVGSDESAQITPAWKGGTYYAAQRRADLKTPKQDTPDSLAIVYYSEWTSKEAARKFAEIYQKQFPRKYEHLKVIKPDTADAPAADSETAYDADGTFAVVSVVGNSVFVSEGFTQPEARKLEALFLAGRTEGAVDATNLPHDLTGGLRGFLGNAGVMRCALPRP